MGSAMERTETMGGDSLLLASNLDESRRPRISDAKKKSMKGPRGVKPPPAVPENVEMGGHDLDTTPKPPLNDDLLPNNDQLAWLYNAKSYMNMEPIQQRPSKPKT